MSDQVLSFEVPGAGITEAVVAAANKWYGNTKPVWTAVVVHSLWNPAVHVEIEVEALLPSDAKL